MTKSQEKFLEEFRLAAAAVLGSNLDGSDLVELERAEVEKRMMLRPIPTHEQAIRAILLNEILTQALEHVLTTLPRPGLLDAIGNVI